MSLDLHVPHNSAPSHTPRAQPGQHPLINGQGREPDIPSRG